MNTCEKCGAQSPEYNLRYFKIYFRESGQYYQRKLEGVRRLRICEKCIQKKRNTYAIGCGFGGFIPFTVFSTVLIELFVFGGNFGDHLGNSILFGLPVGIIAAFFFWLHNKNKSASFLGRFILEESKPKEDQFIHYVDADRDEYTSKKDPNKFTFESTTKEKSVLYPIVFAGMGNDIVDRALEKYHGVHDYEANVTEQMISDLVNQKDTSLLVYFDIDQLGGGVYGLTAGRAIGKAIPPSMMEGMEISSGDSSATLNGSANEYVICMSGSAESITAIKEKLNSEPEIKNLLSSSGISQTVSKEQLVQDGTVKNGEFIIPDGKSASFCAAGFRDAWKK